MESKMTPTRIVAEPVCQYCRRKMFSASCIRCHEPFDANDPHTVIYCSGHGDEAWHRCESCYQKMISVICPECGTGYQNITYYAKDTEDGVVLVYTCQAGKHCNATWESPK